MRNRTTASVLTAHCAALVSVLLVSFASATAAPRHVYLTWQGETSTTMTVNYQTLSSSTSSSTSSSSTSPAAAASLVYYDTQPRLGQKQKYRWKANGTRHVIDGLPDGRQIHWVQLNKLRPNTTYFFIAGDPMGGFSVERKFRTAPADRRPIRFVTGGDTGAGPGMRAVLKRAAKQEPLFVAIGGDLAYCNGNLAAIGRWDAWFDIWGQEMITPTGYSVPMVVAIGNHETRSDGWGKKPADAPFYYGFFAQEQKPEQQRAYFSRTFGRTFALIVLDSGHTADVAGPQKAWLEETLASHQRLPNRFAIYHAPLYPSFRSPLEAPFVAGREHWGPLFDKYRLTAAFENHDHALKRSKKLRGGYPADDGTLYIGDGCMGREPRLPQKREYLEKVVSTQHFWQVDVDRTKVTYTAFDPEGRVIDVYPHDPVLTRAGDLNAFFLNTLETAKRPVADYPFEQSVDHEVVWKIGNPLGDRVELDLAFLPIKDVLTTPSTSTIAFAPYEQKDVRVRVKAKRGIYPSELKARFTFRSADRTVEVARDATVPFLFHRAANVHALAQTPQLSGNLPPALATLPANLRDFVFPELYELAPAQTEVWVAASPGGLFVHALCHEPAAPKLARTSPAKDSIRTPGDKTDLLPPFVDDYIELVVTPGNPRQFRRTYSVTMGGATRFRRDPVSQAAPVSGATAKTFVQENAWVVQLLIPWQDLQRSGPLGAGGQLRVQVNRAHKRGAGPRGLSRWETPAEDPALTHWGALRF